MRMGRDVVVAWVLLGGCAPAVGTDSETDDDSTGTNGTATTAGTASTAGTATTATTTTMTTSVDTTATSTTTTTGEPAGCAGDWVSGCQGYCAALITCHPELGSYEECVMDCVNEIVDFGSECQLAWCDAYACFGTLDCATLDEGSPMCDELASIAESQCGGGESGVGEITGDGECSIGTNGNDECEYECVTDAHRFVCFGDVCTCYVDGTPTQGCDSAGICADADNIDAYAMDCCGW